MAIKRIITDVAGQVGIKPRIVRIETTDSFATVTAANYLKTAIDAGMATFYPDDVVALIYATNNIQFFTLTITSSTITLVPMANEVVLPVVDGDFAIFSGTNGTLDDLGYSPSDLTKSKVVMASAVTTSGRIAQFNDTGGTIGNGPVNADAVLTSQIPSPDVGSNLIAFDITVDQANLASGGSVILIASGAGKRYKIRELYLNSGGTNFAGGGGDRLGQVTDGTTVYSVIPAATMQSLVNARWGTTEVPYPAAAAINASTVAAANLVFSYSGGATDYTTGSLVMSGVVERVA